MNSFDISSYSHVELRQNVESIHRPQAERKIFFSGYPEDEEDNDED